MKTSASPTSTAFCGVPPQNDHFVPDLRFDTHVVFLLAVPELAELVREIFYAQNAMWLDGCTPQSYPRHLPYAMGKFVRQLKLWFRLFVAEQRLLREVLADGVAFPNLDHVGLYIHGTGGNVRVACSEKKKLFPTLYIDSTISAGL
jgi:hypothetical protein